MVSQTVYPKSALCIRRFPTVVRKYWFYCSWLNPQMQNPQTRIGNCTLPCASMSGKEVVELFLQSTWHVPSSPLVLSPKRLTREPAKLRLLRYNYKWQYCFNSPKETLPKSFSLSLSWQNCINTNRTLSENKNILELCWNNVYYARIFQISKLIFKKLHGCTC